MSRLLGSAGQVFHSVRLTLFLSIVVPLMLVVGAGIVLAVNAIEDNLDQRLREDLELVARAASGPLARAVEDGNEIVLDQALKSIFRIGRVYGASIFDADGTQVASLGVADTSVRTSRSANEVIQSGERGGTFRRVDGVPVFSQFTPLVSGDGRIIGLLQVTRKRSDFHRQVASARTWAVALWCLVLVVVSLVVVLGHYGAVGRYVNRLLEAMGGMAPGHWQIRSDASGPREIRQLHEGLCHLGDRMAQAEEEIRQRVQREQELGEQLEYQEKVAMIGRVAGGVAHELGAPLNVIQGRASILARGELGPEELRQLDDIRHQVQRMTRIIEQLLDCFRHVPDARRPVDLAPLLRELVAQVGEESSASGKSITLSMPDEPVFVEAEPTRLELACVNVIRNACEAGHDQVTVTVEPSGDYWQVRVDDDGPGIPEAQRERIFEPFFSTRPAGEGTGLGLAMVKSVIKEHRGRLTVTDSPLGGCRMGLFWPVASPPAEGQEQTV
ncbi:ATP-binding protein [Marinobacter sp. M1N3S26]|uniref:sensor histidine kinase n=1 Tax=unclassified Marinobacter TaxID=83889 RepID=UPI00387B71B7